MKKIQIYENGVDTGYIGDNQKWWFDNNHPDSFEIFDIDGFYSNEYFVNDHISPEACKNFTEAVKSVYNKLTNKELKSIFEAGAGGGWFTKAFLDFNYDIVSIEGTKEGYDKCLKKGISKEIIIKHDLRTEINLNRTFDLAICTEVAEHIEPPFSSQLVLTLVKHSDFIWFSFEPPGTNRAHYHHCNEQPEKFWVNLFDYYNYGMIRLPRTQEDNNVGIYANRGTHIFYNKKKYETLKEI